MVVVFIAVTVKVMNWRKLLRLERRVVESQAERGEIPTSVRTSADRPFGVKALNECSSIEGVWDARTTTPLHGPSSRNSSPLIRSAKKLRRSNQGSVSSIPSLDISEPSPDAKAAGSWSSLLEKGAQSTEMTMPSTAPEESSEQASTMLPKRGKARSITISYSGPSSRPNESMTAPAFETEGLLCKLLTLASMDITDNFLDSTDSVGANVTAVQSSMSGPKLRIRRSFTLSNEKRRRFVIGGRSSPDKTAGKTAKPEKIEVDVIDRMNAHRRLHSAEQGQLIPRTRPHSEDNARTDVDYCSCDEGDVASNRTVSWPANNNVRLSKKPVQPPSQVATAPFVPQGEIVATHFPPKPCPSAWTGRTQDMLDDQLLRNVSAGDTLATPSLCSDATSSTPSTTDDRISIENKTARKINQGFEILPAGSLQKQADLKVNSVWPEASSETDDKKKKPKKLQKRQRRSSSASSRELRSSSESARSPHFALMRAVH